MKVFMIALLIIFMTGCTACIKRPEPIMQKGPDGKRMVEPISCYYYRECEYYKTVDKKSHGDCKAEFIKCAKDLDYRYCQDPENWPEGVTFTHCFDKLN